MTNTASLSSSPWRRMDVHRWMVLVPAAFVTYSLAYLDRLNFGFGAAAGMAEDLHITGTQLGLAGSLSFLGYFIFQVPGAHFAYRGSPTQVTFFSLLAWGPLSIATGLIDNIYLLYLDRFLLGAVEGAVLPAIFMILGNWFVSAERARAISFVLLGGTITLAWMSLASGYLATQLGWRGMFVVEGVPSVLWAFIWIRLISDEPANAPWLSQHDRGSIVRQIDAEQNLLVPIRDMLAAMRSWRVLLLVTLYFWWSVAAYGFTMWSPMLLKSAGLNLVEIGWLSGCLYVLVTLVKVAASFISDRTGVRRGFIWPFFLLAAVAFYASYATNISRGWPASALFIVAGLGANGPAGIFFAYIADMLPRNVSGRIFALINSAGALGSFVGVYVIGATSSLFQGAGASYLTIAAMSLVALFFSLFLPRLSTQRTPAVH